MGSLTTPTGVLDALKMYAPCFLVVEVEAKNRRPWTMVGLERQALEGSREVAFEAIVEAKTGREGELRRDQEV